jgi:hypothetical protein
MNNVDINQLLQRISTDSRVLVTAGTEFIRTNSNEGFFIEVKTAGSVKYDTMGGQTITETMSVGYHPVKMKKIYSTTAVDVAVNF